jgi:transcription elongation factor GreA
MEAIPMTLNGYKRLQDEIRMLKGVERPRVVEAISAARALGDLSENAEYHAAKERQGIIEARILEVENRLSRASIIDVSEIRSDVVRFGCTVEIEECDSGTVSKFQIVGSDEADVGNGFLPITSPIARGLIGRKVGDEVEVSTPSGLKNYVVTSLAYV